MHNSPDIQNQLVKILGDQVRDTIFNKIRRSLCYTLIAGEVTDCSNNIEHLCIVIGYVEPDTSYIREDLVTLERDSGVSGEALAEKILGFVTDHLQGFIQDFC